MKIYDKLSDLVHLGLETSHQGTTWNTVFELFCRYETRDIVIGKSYHGFIWTIHFIVILGVLLLIRTNASSCQSPSVLGFQFP